MSETAALRALNNSAVPAVNARDEAEWDTLVNAGTLYVGPGESGLLLTLPSGLDYASLNYRWFSERYTNFVYVDRVVIAAHARGQGVGRQLYERAIADCRAHGRSAFLAEVNTDPPNPGSMAFHAAMGFRRLEERYNTASEKTVMMFAYELNPAGATKS